MIRSTLQDIYPAIDNLSAEYNRNSYTCIYALNRCGGLGLFGEVGIRRI